MLGIFSSILLSGLFFAEEKAPSTDSSLPLIKVVSTTSPEDKKSAIQAVSNRLKDPESARFSTFYTVTHYGLMPNGERKYYNQRVCGIVNSKNSFGGYTGESLFFVDKLMGVLIRDTTANAGEISLMNNLCLADDYILE
jgi:hypothetical protein